MAENGTAGAPVAFAYDDLGRMTTFAKANNHSQTYGYDSADRLTAWTLAGLAGGTTTVWPYYNPASLRVVSTVTMLMAGIIIR